MRHLLAGLFAAVVGLGSMAAASVPAQAQEFSIRVGEPYGPPPGYRWHRRYERPVGFRPVPVYRHYPRYARPVYDAGPRCFIRTTRVWDGYGWELRRREVCR